MTLQKGILIATGIFLAIALVGLYRTKRWADLFKDIDFTDEGGWFI